jgi:sugar lactone lactonase YvrE
VPDDDDDYEDICDLATWSPTGVTVAGGRAQGAALNQLSAPGALFVDKDRSVYVVDSRNNRVVQWAPGAWTGSLVGSNNTELKKPNGLVVDKKNDALFLCDLGNLRVVRWDLGAQHEQTIVSNVSCIDLTMDKEGSLYLSENQEYRVSKWQRYATSGEVVAGGYGKGSALNQLYMPSNSFVDRDHSVFVADYWNARVVMWPVGATEGIVVAGGNGQGNRADQLTNPSAVFVDRRGTIYIVDSLNHRVVRWSKGATTGNVIAGSQRSGTASDHLWNPSDLAFDRQGNLYVSDTANNRIQMFAIDKSLCS